MRVGIDMPRANPASFREAASRFTTGVAVLTALDEHGRVCGMTANSFVTVSLSPPTVLVSVMPGRMHRAISATGRSRSCSRGSRRSRCSSAASAS